MEFNPNQFANPTGEEGVRLTKHMNIHHSPLTEWGTKPPRTLWSKVGT